MIILRKYPGRDGQGYLTESLLKCREREGNGEGLIQNLV